MSLSCVRCLMFFALLLLTTFALPAAHASCTLQLHVYSYEGHGFPDSTVTITNGVDVLLDNWSMSREYYEMVEFPFHGDQLEVEYNSAGSTEGGYVYIAISNSSGNPLKQKQIYYSSYPRGDVDTYEFTCDQTDDTLISLWDYAQPDLEPQCYDGYEDEFNGGCNSPAEAFTEVHCGETVFGTVSQFRSENLMVNDEDWYLLNIPLDTSINLDAFMEIPTHIEIIRHDQCDDQEIVNAYDVNAGFFHASSIFLETGQYAVRIAPRPHFAFPCDSGMRYAFSIECKGRPTESTCATEAEQSCENDFEYAFNDVCESVDDTVSELRLGCINGGSTGSYTREGMVTTDFDYFSFQVWEEQAIPILIEGMAPLTVTLFYGDCGDHTFIESLDIEPFITTSSLLGPLVAGEYVLLVEPRDGAGVYCGSNYKILLDAGVYGNSVNTAAPLDTGGLFNSYFDSDEYGDTTFAENLYDSEDYGCGHSVDIPETVHSIRVPEGITVSMTVTAEDFEPHFVVTKSWPPEECLAVEPGPEDSMTAFLPKMILHPDTTYFVFVEGETQRGGSYELRLDRLDPTDYLMEVDLTLNQEQFATGDPILLTGEYRNNTGFSRSVYLGLALEIEGAFWFYDSHKEWVSTPPEYFESDYIVLGDHRERTFIDATWPEMDFKNIRGLFSFFLFSDYWADEINLLSNVDTEEFLF